MENIKYVLLEKLFYYKLNLFILLSDIYDKKEYCNILY